MYINNSANLEKFITDMIGSGRSLQSNIYYIYFLLYTNIWLIEKRIIYFCRLLAGKLKFPMLIVVVIIIVITVKKKVMIRILRS